MRTTNLMAGFLLAALGAAQEPQETTRQLWNEEFLNKRPAGKQGTPQRQIRYQQVPGAAPTKIAGSRPLTLGVTLWRLNRSPKGNAPGARLLVLEASGSADGEALPERVEANTVLAEGDHVRLSVEVPANGYLYVIDREQYSDGTFSDPFLIYPNSQSRAGDNAVAPGRVLEIPDRRDKPNAFTVKSSRPGQTAELLSFLISPDPHPELRAGDAPLRLDPRRFSEWENKWSVAPEKFELLDGVGVPWSEVEKAAGADHQVMLTQDDAMPQTLYRVSRQPGSSILFQIPLRFK